MCRRFDTIPACVRRTDRRTDGQTGRQTDGIAVASTALAMRALRRAVKNDNDRGAGAILATKRHYAGACDAGDRYQSRGRHQRKKDNSSPSCSRPVKSLKYAVSSFQSCN